VNVIYTDVLVIGGGLAGLRLGIGAKRRGHDVIVLSLVPPKRSHSCAAQGGMQASLGNVVKAMGDNEDVHFEDTVRGSDWGADQRVVRMFVDTAPKAVRELAAWGVPWSRVQKGDRQVIINGQKVTITERDEAHGLVMQRDFGGTKKWRACYVSDGTGHAMLYAMSDQAIAQAITVHERMEAMALIHDGSRCHGAVVRNLVTGELIAYVAKATAIASGGAGRLYRATTNAVICEGIGTALALETGVATVANMEAIQFHPTAIFPASILVTEGCRGDGGLLRDAEGKRFMPDYEPEKKELASRDVVARRMEEHIRRGAGVKSRFGEHLWLDITLLGAKHINSNLREVKEICQHFLGIDPIKDWIPVRPAQHYTMGGVRTDHTGGSPTLKGLYAAGEAACWDLHGFNRLGGNSVAETVVAGMIVGEYIADFCDRPESDLRLSTGLISEFLEHEQAKLDALAGGKGSEDANTLRVRMQEIMMSKVGIFRTGEDLAAAVEELQELLRRSRNIRLRYTASGANPELVSAYRVRKMLRLALCVAYGALTRTESRGAHFRHDYPRRNDAEWLHRTLATWKNADDTLPTLAREPIDVMQMELPPGWRGYGAKDYVDHPTRPVTCGQKRSGRLASAVAGGTAGADAVAARCPSASGDPTTHRRAVHSVRRGASVPTPQATPPPTTAARCAPQGADQRLALQPAGPRQRPADTDLRARRSGRQDALHSAQRDPRKAGRVSAIRFRLPCGDMRQLRDGDQRKAGSSMPYADAEPGT
jgi:fumarate reductase flavoprotein subunit